MADFRHQFDEARRISIVELVGDATEAEWLAAASELPQTERILIDLRKGRVATLSSEQVTSVAHALRRAAPAPRMAIVAERDADYGVVRRWSVLLSLPGADSAPFRTYDEAVIWLTDLPAVGT